MTFAERLKALRETAGLSQSGLAKASGRSLGAIRDYEQGKKEPTLKAAVQIAKALGVPINELVDAVSWPSPKKGGGKKRK